MIGQNEVKPSGEMQTSIQATLGINTTTKLKKNMKNGHIITLF